MDQELKQRLIGATIITALAAIFVPMLFDDTVDDAGKEVNTLTIPELPAKVQEVEITPLPEKSEDIVSEVPVEKNLKTAPRIVDDGETELDVAPTKPKTRLSSKSSDNTTVKHLPAIENNVALGDEDRALPEAEDVVPVIKPVVKPSVSNITPNVTKPLKPVVKPSAPNVTPVTTSAESAVTKSVIDNGVKPATNTDAGTRWYLNAGSFGQKVNAISLQDMLKQQGITSTLKEVQTDKGVVYKVRIGPLADRAKAQAEKAKLSQLNVNSFLAPEE